MAVVIIIAVVIS